MAGTFVYSALPEGSIRLLNFSSLAPGELVCNMSEVTLDEYPEFYALSYAWGCPAATESNLCNGRVLKIGVNLCEAIHTLFIPPVCLNFPIWIDAICINQHNDEEKNHQVGQMGDIYRRAQKVVVWLGPARDNSDLAMEWLERLSLYLPRIRFLHQLEQLSEFGLPDRDDDVWLALGRLYRRKWFGRLWTFQEIVLAAEVLMSCGQKIAKFTEFATVARELNRLTLTEFCNGYQTIVDHEDGIMTMSKASWARKTLATSGFIQAPDVLLIADRKICFDPHDRVYAMLGMTSKSFQNRIRVSYSKNSDGDILRTYIECAKACIEERYYKVLESVAGRPRLLGLPSWCPNLHSSQGEIEPFQGYLSAGVGKHTSYFESFPGKTSLESNKLKLTGFRADTVSEVVEGSFNWPNALSYEQGVQREQSFLEWEGRCLALARKTLSVSPETVPPAHFFALSPYTRQQLSNIPNADFLQAYLDVVNMKRKFIRGCIGGFPPIERRALFHDTWNRIYHSCSGRRYMSTKTGLLGLGPPDVKKGDTICVFYGIGPVFVLRPVDENPEEWNFVGDAFVHGLMELDETPQSARGADEVFTII